MEKSTSLIGSNYAEFDGLKKGDGQLLCINDNTYSNATLLIDCPNKSIENSDFCFDLFLISLEY